MNQWVAFTPTDQGYADISAGLALPAALSQDVLTGPYQVGSPSVIGAQRVVPISGTAVPAGGGRTGPGTLYITPGRATLPVELDASGADGSTSTIRFGQWGVPVALRAPAAAIAAASLAATAATPGP